MRSSALGQLALLMVALLVSSCELGQTMRKVLRTGQTDPGVTQGPGSVGIKSAQTLIASLESVTGVSAADATVVETLSGTDGSLPLNEHVNLSLGFLSKSAEISSLNSTHMLVATSLGSAFAREQIRREASRAPAQRILTADVDFSKRPSEALTDAVVGKLINNFARRYVQRAPLPEEVVTLKQCVVDILGDIGVPSSAARYTVATQQAISGCIAAGYLGSADFLRQ